MLQALIRRLALPCYIHFINTRFSEVMAESTSTTALAVCYSLTKNRKSSWDSSQACQRQLKQGVP